jgi:hypothetical protein
VSHCTWIVLFSIGFKFLMKIINHDCEKPWEVSLSSWSWQGCGGSHASLVSLSHSKSFIKLERMKHKRFYEGGIHVDEWKRILHRCTPGNLFPSVSLLMLKCLASSLKTNRVSFTHDTASRFSRLSACP